MPGTLTKLIYFHVHKLPAISSEIFLCLFFPSLLPQFPLPKQLQYLPNLRCLFWLNLLFSPNVSLENFYHSLFSVHWSLYHSVSSILLTYQVSVLVEYFNSRISFLKVFSSFSVVFPSLCTFSLNQLLVFISHYLSITSGLFSSFFFFSHSLVLPQYLCLLCFS